MTTPVKICSNALLRLGSKPIADLNEATPMAQVAANLYPAVRDSVLRMHPWNCAMKRAQLAQESVSPPFGYTYAYALPSDFLRAWVVTDDGIHPIEYAVERRSLLTDSGTVYLQYVFRNEDPSTWDTNLLELMEVRMAAAMAMAVTGDAGKKQEFEREALQIMRMARAVDGMENPAQPFPESSLMSVRR